jgi:hypothetical protein
LTAARHGAVSVIRGRIRRSVYLGQQEVFRACNLLLVRHSAENPDMTYYDGTAKEFQAAVEAFRRHDPRPDAERIVRGLADGLTLLRELFYHRIHQDVERSLGKDSLLMPVSEAKALRLVSEETELYQTAESAAAAERGYVSEANRWYLKWLARLRLGERAANPDLDARLSHYEAAATDDRRLAFADALNRVFPESRQAPLVLFRLFPLAVQIVTAQAFDDRATAEQLRQQQVAILPAIVDCRQCHGRLLDPAARCDVCGNPLWKYEYLTRS